MKNILIILLLLTSTVYGQKTISNPKTVLDTTQANTRFIFSWDGNTKLFMTDSITSYNNMQPVFNHDYISTTKAYARLEIKMLRIPATGDTLIRYKTIDIPFLDIEKALTNYYDTPQLRKSIKKSLRKEYIKKLSQE